MTTKTEPVVSPQEIWEAARERREVRRNRYQSYTETEELRAKLDGRSLPRMSLYAPEFRPPETAAEYFDDLILARQQFRGLPESPVLLAVAVAARESADAAVRAVQAARQLDKRVQWVVRRNLESWKTGDHAAKTGADRIIARVIGAWSDLKLAEINPDRGY